MEREHCGSSLHILLSHIRQINHLFRMRVDLTKADVYPLIEYDAEHRWIAIDAMDITTRDYNAVSIAQ